MVAYFFHIMCLTMVDKCWDSPLLTNPFLNFTTQLFIVGNG